MGLELPTPYVLPEKMDDHGKRLLKYMDHMLDKEKMEEEENGERVFWTASREGTRLRSETKGGLAEYKVTKQKDGDKGWAPCLNLSTVAAGRDCHGERIEVSNSSYKTWITLDKGRLVGALECLWKA